jgi:hypothetical protein
MATKKFQVKTEHKDKVFGFNNSIAPLGQREDIHLLIADAQYHELNHILDLFEEVPEGKTSTAEVEKKK